MHPSDSNLDSARVRRREPRRRGRTAIVAALGAVALLAAACSSAAANSASDSPTTSAPPTRPTVPSASGTVATITGTSMEVQNPTSGQVTVSWTPTTTFIQTLTVAASSVTPGECVTATGPLGTGGSSTTGPVSATIVSLTQPDSSGNCTALGGTGGAGFGGGAGGAGAGRRFTGGTLPNGGTFPNGGTVPRNGSVPPGAGQFANFSFASGKVTQLSSGGFTLDGVLRSAGGLRPRTSSSAKTTTTTTPPARAVTITTSSTTAYSQTATATASALAAGKCVTARGPADQTGAITATSISIRSPGPNGCSTFGGFGAGAGGAPGGSTSTG